MDFAAYFLLMGWWSLVTFLYTDDNINQIVYISLKSKAKKGKLYKNFMYI